MSTRGLHNFLTEVYSGTTASQISARINVELAKIKKAFLSSKLSSHNRKKYITKLCFIVLSGCHVSFGAQQVLELIRSRKNSMQKVGWMAAAVVCGNDNEQISQLVPFIKKQLLDVKNENGMNLALSAVASIGGVELAEAFGPTIADIVISKSFMEHTRKKAILALARLYKSQQLPLVDTFVTKLIDLLNDSSFGIRLSACHLIHAIQIFQPALVACTFPTILENLNAFFLKNEYDHDFSSTELPCTVLVAKMFQILSFKDHWKKEELFGFETIIATILSKFSTKKDEERLISYFTVFAEIVFLVLTVPISDYLLHQIFQILITNLNSNILPIKYFCLKNLSMLVRSFPIAFSFSNNYLENALELMKSRDPEIDISSANLLYVSANQENGLEILSEFFDYLPKAPFYMRKLLLKYSSILAKSYAENEIWCLDKLFFLICFDNVDYRNNFENMYNYNSDYNYQENFRYYYSNDYQEDDCYSSRYWYSYDSIYSNNFGLKFSFDYCSHDNGNNFNTESNYFENLWTIIIDFVSRKPKMQNYLVKKLCNIIVVQKFSQTEQLLKLIAYAIGEYSSFLDGDLYQIISNLMNIYEKSSNQCKSMFITCFFKLAVKFPEYREYIASFMNNQKKSLNNDICQRCNEYTTILTFPENLLKNFIATTNINTFSPKINGIILPDLCNNLYRQKSSYIDQAVSLIDNKTNKIMNSNDPKSINTNTLIQNISLPQTEEESEEEDTELGNKIASRFLTTTEGEIFSNNFIQISVSLFLYQPNARLVISILARQDVLISEFSLSSEESLLFRTVDFDLNDNIFMESGNIKEIHVDFVAVDIFDQMPVLKFKINQELNSTNLPILFPKWMQQMEMDRDTFFSRWNAVNDDISSTRISLTIPNGNVMDILKKIVKESLGLDPLNIDLPYNNVVMCGIFKCSKKSIGILLRFVFNEDSNNLSLFIKTTSLVALEIVKKRAYDAFLI